MVNAFELPSAKNLTVKKVVQMFVPTTLYWEILCSDMNNVIFGTRGSGKTMLLRMMSLRHLVRFAEMNERAAQALREERRFGVFVPLGIDWCVAYRRDGDEEQRLFRDGVNLVTADAFVDALEELLRCGLLEEGRSSSIEVELSKRLSDQWFRQLPREIVSLTSLRSLLLKNQSILRDVWATRVPSRADEEGDGYNFRSGSLFSPIVDGVRLSNEVLQLPSDHRWLLCLDELEDLSEEQVRAMTTALRGKGSNLVFKITTQPYTLQETDTTFADAARAIDFREYEVKRLQYDPKDEEYQALVAEMLRKRLRVEQSEARSVAVGVFGERTFADRAADVDGEFLTRKDRLLSSGDRDSNRKKIPVLAIRALRRAAEGHRRSSAYSGWTTIVRISDGNPGMFVRLMNELGVGPGTTRIPEERQHMVLNLLAEGWLEWALALYRDGRVLHQLLQTLGEILSERLHAASSDETQIEQETSRFVVDLQEIGGAHAEAFRVGARHSLLVADAMGSSFRYPRGKGVWRLSYALSPRFWLLPRKGRAVKYEKKQLSFEFAKDLGDLTQVDEGMANTNFPEALVADGEEV